MRKDDVKPEGSFKKDCLQENCLRSSSPPLYSVAELTVK